MLDLEVFRGETGMLCDASQHARADFVAIMKSKHKIWKIRSPQNTMRARLTLD